MSILNKIFDDQNENILKIKPIVEKRIFFKTQRRPLFSLET